ncbi:MAG: DUF58 domain-containing protein [Clostridiales bacterium]|jgi:uncharacterized protein (DUF58 family)|nr:DUF58 domain-containing protein [Clostridiales bacterium]
MKHTRRLIIILGAFCLGLGLYSGDKIYFIGLSVIVSLIIYAFITNIWVILDFRYLQNITPQQVSKGEPAALVIQIHNDKPFIYPYIKVFYKVPESALNNDSKEKVLSVLPFQYGEIRENFICSLRGEYTLGITHIEVRDPFGLFVLSTNLANRPYYKPLYLKVTPRILNISALPLPRIRNEGSSIQEFFYTEEPASLADIRQYRYGDPLKKIHWNISAKLQDIYVKNYETTAQSQILIFLETSPFPVDGMLRYRIEDQAVECAVSVIYFILTKSLPAQLIIYHRERQQISGKNPEDFPRFFDYISMLPFSSPFSAGEILLIESPGFSKGQNIILIIHNLNHNLFNQLCRFRQSDIHPFILFIHPPGQVNAELRRMIDELNKRDIPCITVPVNERLDHILERTL